MAARKSSVVGERRGALVGEASGPVTLMERYALAIGSDNLTSSAHTLRSDADLLAGMGCAARRLSARNEHGWSHLGSDALARVMAGDRRAVGDVVDGYAARLLERGALHEGEIGESRARAIVKACLAWLVAGTCKICEGRKVALAQGSSNLTGSPCAGCGGSGKVSFRDNFQNGSYAGARWVAATMISDLQTCETELANFVGLET